METVFEDIGSCGLPLVKMESTAIFYGFTSAKRSKVFQEWDCLE